MKQVINEANHAESISQMTNAELLLLLYEARESFQSVYLSWTYRYQPAAIDTLMQREQAEHPPGSFTYMTSPDPADTPAWQEVKRRVWWQKPHHWRSEQIFTHHTITLIDEEKNQWWVSMPQNQRLVTNHPPDTIPDSFTVQSEHQPRPIARDLQEVPLLDPAFLLASHRLTLTDTGTFLNRDVLHVSGQYWRNASLLRDAAFWARADRYHFLVDRKTGLLLRYAALLDDREIAVAEVDTCQIDEVMPRDIFALHHLRG